MLSRGEHQEAFAQLIELDRAVNKIGLDAAKKYMKTLGKAGAAKLHKRLKELDAGSDDAALYKTTDSKYGGAAGNKAYQQGGVERAAAVKAAFPGDQRQPCKTLLELLVFATADEAEFKKQVNALGKACGAVVLLADLKGP